MTSLADIRTLAAGAKFYRADLHIHSYGGSHDVRDAAMTPEAVVDAAIAEGLGVIAITDHNDIRNVEQALAAAAGKPLLVVPGVELSTPDGHLLCYTETLEALRRFHARLNIVGVDGPDSRCQQGVLDCLNLLQGQGGFGVLAHVDTDGGLEQVRPGASPHKVDIICHAALLGIEVKTATSDISWSPDDPQPERAQMGRTRIERLTLGEKQFLARLLGSDAHTLAALGRNAASAKKVTRIKMDSPSFKALRLAMEDSDARIRLEDQIPPSVPMIIGAHFDGGFLDGQTLHLSPNLNCIIGGRGTGKSTTFEAVRCLSQSPSEESVVDSEVWPEALYLFVRDGAGVEHSLYRGKGQEVQNLDDEVFGPTHFEIDCFGQGDTARISAAAKKDPLSLLDYLDRFTNVRAALEAEGEASDQLRASQQTLRTLEKQVAAIPEFKKALELTRKQLAALEKADAKGLIDLQRKVEEERSLRQQIISRLKALQGSYRPSVQGAAAHLKAATPATPLILGSTEFAEIVASVEAFEAQISSLTAQSVVAWKPLVDLVNDRLQKWKAKEGEKLAEIEAQRKALEAQGIRLDMNAIRRVTQDEASHQRTIGELEAKAALLKEHLREHQQARDRRWSARQKVSTARTAYAAGANRVLGDELSDLKVTLKFAESACSPDAERLIIDAMGWRTNQQPRAALLVNKLTVRRLIDCIDRQDSTPIEALEDEGHVRPFSRQDAQQMLSRLRDPGNRDYLETVAIHDLPRLIVTKKVEDGSGTPKFVRREFAKLSLGQQQSVLLALMLSATTDAPLIIDQPEDNLDGEFIYHTLVPVLRRAKERRQVIVVTHNANIAVLGDAELLVVLKSSSDRGQVVERGAIDEAGTRKEACKILEGAREAFQRRAKTYGFTIAGA